ncbi:MAG TPA: tRNA pseudouridine(55) synthase TruB [Solirubrobacteraceae bacterium]|nr:tRNA pseudouridine(55) synthase TruB [Solirubrobacteraceae bacterium]
MDGLVLVDKPAGKTSHDLTLATRRALGIRKAGHAGTLDPFATGLLLVLVGRARRVQRFLMALPKTYEVVARLGAVSTTGDPEGEITETGRIPDLDAPLPTGTIMQRPPIWSAVRVQGRKAYERARAGEQFEIAPREVTVYRFELLGRDGDRASFLIECSAGTYVRSLIAELGDAYCVELRRTTIGPFRVEDADPTSVLALEQALAFLPRVDLDEDTAWRAAHGQTIAVAAEGEHVLLADADGPVAIAQPLPDGTLKPVVGFRG